MAVIFDDIFTCIFLNDTIKISLKFLPKCPGNNVAALVQIMAWRRPGRRPLLCNDVSHWLGWWDWGWEWCGGVGGGGWGRVGLGGLGWWGLVGWWWGWVGVGWGVVGWGW